MPSFQEMPTKEQIAAIDDVEALEDIRDEVDRARARIETDLEYSERDDDWALRARNALALHRYVGSLIGRRLAQLEREARTTAPAHFSRKPRPGARTRREADCSALTLAAFDGEIVDPDEIPDELPALETALGVVSNQINALRDDKDDEVTRFAQNEIDHGFLTRVGVAQRRCGAAHQALLKRAAAIRKVEKVAVQNVRDATRPQLFVDAAREVLDRETFLAVWEVVDRREAASARDKVA